MDVLCAEALDLSEELLLRSVRPITSGDSVEMMTASSGGGVGGKGDLPGRSSIGREGEGMV